MLFVILRCIKCQKDTYHHLRSSIHEVGHESIKVKILCVEHDKANLKQYDKYSEMTLTVNEFSYLTLKQVSDTWHHSAT